VDKKIGFWEAFAIGVGGMVGGGIFAVLGLTIQLARGAAPLAFAMAGLIALLTAYSYVKLSLRYPSEGGTIEFIVQAYGNGVFSAVVNILMVMSYVVMLALYAYAFGSYGAALVGMANVQWLQKSFAVVIIVILAMINLMGATTTGKTEDILVFIKILILMIFVIAGLRNIDYERLSPRAWEPIYNIAAGSFIIFLAYEGFELIANTAKDIRNPAKNLKLAYYSSVLFVIVLYVLIAVVAIGHLSFAEVAKAKDYALAEAARPFFGQTGFVLIGIAALLSTASAINATIYGSGRTSYLVAKLGELPESFEKRFEHGYEGMIIISLLGIIFATSFNLDNISVAGSAGFLIIFMLVNFAGFKLAKEVKASRIITLAGGILCSIAIAVLIWYNAVYSPASLISSGIVLAAVLMFSISFFTYKKEGKIIAEYIDKELEWMEKAGKQKKII